MKQWLSKFTILKFKKYENKLEDQEHKQTLKTFTYTYIQRVIAQ
jgi:hypothetical protein